MKKQVLLLSVAVAALAASPAFADDWTDITTALNVPIDTAHAANGEAGDIHIESTGSVTVKLAGAAVTINSDNSFLADAGSTISNIGTSDAVGILVDLTAHNIDSTCTDVDCVSGLTEAGTIDLSGAGDTKRGLWLQGPADDTTGGPFMFTGDIDMSNSTMTVTGDSSVGVLIDTLADLKGNLSLGTINISPTSSTSTLGVIGLEVDGIVYGDIHQVGSINVTGNATTAAGSLIGMNLTGTINGDVVIDKGGAVNATGAGALGIKLTGNIDSCDTGVVPDCTSNGALVNHGTIATHGGGTGTGQTGNPVANSALAIGGSINGGIYNDGASFKGEDTAAATIFTQGSAPAIVISTALENRDVGEDPFPIDIGKYTAETIDPGFSLYNRGIVSVQSSNLGDDTQAVTISGSSLDAAATLDGGIFNSGLVQALATSVKDGSQVSAIAFHINNYALIGIDDTYTRDANGQFNYDNPGSGKLNSDALHDDLAAFVNSAEAGQGVINATISGPMGGNAIAIDIEANANLPSLINTGSITAVATTTDTSITGLAARAIWDQSGTLNYIQNNGIISATATTLDEGGQISYAIDLSADKDGTDPILILNQATVNSAARIIGDIRFGTGDYQTIDVEGASTDNVATIVGDISYGGGSTPGSDKLTIGDFATVTSKITADATVGVSVLINNGGTLNLLNDDVSKALNASDFTVNSGGTLNLTVKQEFTSGIIDSAGPVFFDHGALFNIQYGSFVPSTSDFVLISAPRGDITLADQGIYQQQINDDLPFLFDSARLFIDDTDPVDDKLTLEITPKDASQLGLTGYAAQILPFANQALANDDVLGAAFVAGISDQKTAQIAYNEMAPDVTGGARAIAIALTDQSSGPVAARQRVLRMYGKETGEVTLWGEEFAEFVQDPGNRSTGQTGFKDHGFGFVLGMDGGDPKAGWYGGAFSFYTGDIVEPLPRNSHTNTLWYMLTGYTDWRGKGLFLDTKADIGYMTLKSKRFINLTLPNATTGGTVPFVDEADGKRPGIVGALGMTTGAILAYGSTTITPQLSIDGMTMRQEGYTETHVGTSSTGNGKGMDLQTQSFYASSARVFLGTEVREDLNFGDFFLQPDVRVGYRYDFINDATKLKVNFANVSANSNTPGPTFTVIGPDPAQGNFVAGAAISATTDAWTLGANFDFVRGTNGATTEVGTVHLLGRI
ncbi:MAG: autotransporter outer membrane beta-barrel domain-containing protein [Alphaproteobacteria bacterium]|nr:autotransporter outer membrane beta-barrel domain-containing protein [Alphaproteobacteria bacterium]